ncbi:type 4 pilus major pilin [Pseudomonas sp. WS 5027]|uniref:type 4 pilus major pilin n=1 Tax=Pseudomonas sp. WS 5027 TaxID=2717483 RepID=UPI001472DCC0|nr:type 4 pilus major pilin [Pseudomonas sp. WS 5027]NMY48368.1 hypothetical protein [Pseudomonas sp. WS 5027]
MKIKTRNNIGLTLIEALIWFAIFAAVVAGVFALYSQSRNSSNASTVNKELSTIFSQTEQLFASEDTAQLTTGGNRLAMNLGIYPSSLKTTKGGIKVQNVFGGEVTIDGQTPSGFSIQYTNIPKGEVCANIVKSQKAVGWDSVGTVKYNEDYKISNVSTYCGSNGSGVITLKFARENANGGTATP